MDAICVKIIIHAVKCKDYGRTRKQQKASGCSFLTETERQSSPTPITTHSTCLQRGRTRNTFTRIPPPPHAPALQGGTLTRCGSKRSFVGGEVMNQTSQDIVLVLLSRSPRLPGELNPQSKHQPEDIRAAPRLLTCGLIQVLSAFSISHLHRIHIFCRLFSWERAVKPLKGRQRR